MFVDGYQGFRDGARGTLEPSRTATESAWLAGSSAGDGPVAGSYCCWGWVLPSVDGGELASMLDSQSPVMIDGGETQLAAAVVVVLSAGPAVV